MFYLLHCLPGTMADKEQAVANLRRSLTASGLLLVGRTTAAGRNNATLFRLTDGRFVPERVVNDGADIHDIVVDLAPPPDPLSAGCGAAHT